MNVFKKKYGNTALIAGASEGMGAAFAEALAKRGLDLILIARRKELLDTFAESLKTKYNVDVKTIACDLADAYATEYIASAVAGIDINFFVYNACLSYIGPYLNMDVSVHSEIADVNMNTPIKMLHYFGGRMVEKGRGGIVVMSSLAGLQGSGYLTTYAATKAFNKIIAEGLWYEWKPKGVDVIACCAGATATPNYINTKPAKTSFFEPKPQLPQYVVEECLQMIGKKPSFISGSGNRFASFIMHKILPKKMAVNIMGNATKKMYRIE